MDMNPSIEILCVECGRGMIVSVFPNDLNGFCMRRHFSFVGRSRVARRKYIAETWQQDFAKPYLCRIVGFGIPYCDRNSERNAMLVQSGCCPRMRGSRLGAYDLMMLLVASVGQKIFCFE